MNDRSALGRLITVEDRSTEFPVIAIGNDWSRAHYDGPFHIFAAPRHRPAVSLVFVQSRDGNTGADNPADLGGGPTDKDLIYEGLSRVAADAVLAGASTVGRSVLFTITQPELVALRLSLGLPRHPTQIVMSKDGNVDLEARLFNTADVTALILGGPVCVERLAPRLRDRPWITLLPIADSLSLTFGQLRDHGVGRISAVGGRTVATSLVDAGLVQDLYLTTTAADGGEPATPWYAGTAPPRLQTIVKKIEDSSVAPITFEHLALG